MLVKLLFPQLFAFLVSFCEQPWLFPNNSEYSVIMVGLDIGYLLSVTSRWHFYVSSIKRKLSCPTIIPRYSKLFTNSHGCSLSPCRKATCRPGYHRLVVYSFLRYSLAPFRETGSMILYSFSMRFSPLFVYLVTKSGGRDRCRSLLILLVFDTGLFFNIVKLLVP